MLAQAAHISAPINVRNVTTLGGVLASAGFNAPLPVVLLALDAVLVIYSPEARQSPLSSFLAYREKLLRDGALIAEVGLPLSMRTWRSKRSRGRPATRLSFARRPNCGSITA